MQRDAHDAARVHPRGLALLVQRGCLSIAGADTGDTQARTQVTLSNPGYAPMLRVHTRRHSTGRDTCACARGYVCSEVAHGHHREEAAKTPEKARLRPLGSPGSGPEGVWGAAAGGKCEADAAIALLKEPGLAVPSYRPYNPVSQQSPFRKSFISL